jgi:transposase
MKTQPRARRPYPSDVSDEEWSFVAPYLSLLPQTAAQRRHELREVFNALRWLVRAGAPWRLLPVHFPPWEAVYQQTRRWIAAGVFAALVHDLRLLVRAAAGRNPQPSAAIADSRTLRSTVESGERAGVDGHKGVRGSKVHVVVDTMGTLLALSVTPANETERRQVGALAQQVQEATGESVQILYADAAYTGEETAAAAQEQGMEVVVVKRPEASKGFVLLPKRWVVERSLAWTARFRRLARDYERLPTTLAGLHFAAFVCLLLPKLLSLIGGS